MSLTTMIPALPVTSIPAAVACYTEVLGFGLHHVDDEIAILVRDTVELHLWEASDTGWRHRQADDVADCPVRTGAEDFIAGTASCRIGVDSDAAVDALYAELAPLGVLHPTDDGSPVDTPWGTREFAVLDLDGNLLTYFSREDRGRAGSRPTG